MIRRRWYLVRHICADYWEPPRPWEVLGQPLAHMSVRVYGPWKSEADAIKEAADANFLIRMSQIMDKRKKQENAA